MIRISTCSYRRGRHVLLVDVDNYAFLGRLGLAGCGRNRDRTDDCKNNDKQTDFHVSSPKITEAIQLPRPRRLSSSLQSDRSISPCALRQATDTLTTYGWCLH